MFLGLDVGGSHCRIAWWPVGTRPDDSAVAVQPAVHGLDATVRGLATALAAASCDGAPDAAVCALAGVGDAAMRKAIAHGLTAAGIAFPVAIVGDVLAGAAAALAEGPGVLLQAGTGSFAIARAAHGELVRVGGRGYLLGDQGSGYDLVRRAAAAALLAVDDLGPATALGEALVAAFGAPSPQRLGAVLQGLDTGQVAARLPAVLAVAAAGDAVANDVLAAGAEALAMLAVAVARRADLDLRDLPITFGGGVLLGAEGYRELVADRLGALGARPPQLLDARAAARGAAWLAGEWFARRQPAAGWVDHVAL